MDRQKRQPLLLHQLVQEIDDLLRPPNGKRRNQQHAAARHRVLHHPLKLIGGIEQRQRRLVLRQSLAVQEVGRVHQQKLRQLVGGGSMPLWLYVSGALFTLGAEVNCVLGARRG